MNPKRSWVVVAGVVVAAFVGISLGLFLGSPDDASPSLVIVGRRHEGGRGIVDFRVDVPVRRRAFLHVASEAKIVGLFGERMPSWYPQDPVFQRPFTNNSPTFGVLAPTDCSVWRLRLIVCVEASATRLVIEQAKWRLKHRKIGWGSIYEPTTHWIVSEPITNVMSATTGTPAR